MPAYDRQAKEQFRRSSTVGRLGGSPGNFYAEATAKYIPHNIRSSAQDTRRRGSLAPSTWLNSYPSPKMHNKRKDKESNPNRKVDLEPDNQDANYNNDQSAYPRSTSLSDMDNQQSNITPSPTWRINSAGLPPSAPEDEEVVVVLEQTPSQTIPPDIPVVVLVDPR